MIEEIKKEIENSGTYSIGDIEFQNKRITIKKAFEILDKYKDKEDKYKNAWEELKEYIMTLETQLRHKNWAECERVMFVGTNNARLKIEEIEKMNGIEVK